MDDTQTLPAGTVLDGIYAIEGLLGSGGFANTYLAMDRSLGRHVAIKEYFPREIATRTGITVDAAAAGSKEQFDTGRERFVKEARTLRSLKHSHIVRVFRSFDANGTSYIAQELVEGQDLEDWLRGLQTTPNQEDCDKIVIPLLDALSHVHALNILHRDITPRNVRVRAIDGLPVLLDFGAAREVGTGSGTKTAPIFAAGYAPPESYARETSRLGLWTDIYSLSATFYRMLAGVAPMQSPERALNDTMVPAARLPLPAGFRTAFLEAIDWGLALQPAKRPQNLAQWREKLLEGRASTTISRRQISRPQRPRPAPGSSPSVPRASKPSKQSAPAQVQAPGRSVSRVAVASMGLGLLLIAGGVTVASLDLSVEDFVAMAGGASRRAVKDEPRNPSGKKEEVAIVVTPDRKPVEKQKPEPPAQPRSNDIVRINIRTDDPPEGKHQEVPKPELRIAPKSPGEPLFPKHDAAVTALYASKQTLVTGTEKGQLRLWKHEEKMPTLVRDLRVDGAVVGLALDHDNGGRVAVASSDGGVTIWNAATNQKVQHAPPKGQRRNVMALEFLPGPQRFAALMVTRERIGAFAASLAQWSIDGNPSEAPRLLKTGGEGIDAGAIAPIGNHVAVSSNRNIMLFAGSREPPALTLSLDGTARTLAFSQDGRRLAAAGQFGKIIVWDSGDAGFEAARRLELDLAKVPNWRDEIASQLTALSFSPDGRFLAAAVADDRVFIWDTKSAERQVTVFPATRGSPERDPGWVALLQPSAGLTNVVIPWESDGVSWARVPE